MPGLFRFCEVIVESDACRFPTGKQDRWEFSVALREIYACLNYLIALWPISSQSEVRASRGAPAAAM
jgi:hypothetical protein|tara:strand:- start:200 stop:400 length:201 start_codon:yes stop_codon:yes gene_type:complete